MFLAFFAAFLAKMKIAFGPKFWHNEYEYTQLRTRKPKSYNKLTIDVKRKKISPRGQFWDKNYPKISQMLNFWYYY